MIAKFLITISVITLAACILGLFFEAAFAEDEDE